MRSRLREALGDVQKKAAWLAFIITLPSLGVPTLISTLLNPGKLTEKGITALWETFILTAPLTAGI